MSEQKQREKLVVCVLGVAFLLKSRRFQAA